MQTETPIDYSKFEVIYRTSFPMYHIYKFINVIPYRTGNVVFHIGEDKFMLEISAEQLEKHATNTKEECISAAINNTTGFLKHVSYLYKHEGKFGKYNIKTQTFEPFRDKNDEAKVHLFYYNTISMANKDGYRIC